MPHQDAKPAAAPDVVRKSSDTPQPFAAAIGGSGAGLVVLWVWNSWGAPPAMAEEVAVVLGGVGAGLLGPAYRKLLRWLNK